MKSGLLPNENGNIVCNDPSAKSREIALNAYGKKVNQIEDNWASKGMDPDNMPRLNINQYANRLEVNGVFFPYGQGDINIETRKDDIYVNGKPLESYRTKKPKDNKKNVEDDYDGLFDI